MYWYEDEVKHLENDVSALGYEPETLFYGSSTIRLWADMYSHFSEQKPVNLGFGGSTLAACVWFFERIMANYNPQRLVIYAGDNDLGDGRHPEEVFIFFQQLMVKVTKRFGNIPCYYISLKPSIARWNLASVFKYANSLIQEEINANAGNWHYIDLFDKMLDGDGKPNVENYANDGLHLSEKGYVIWEQAIREAILA